MDVNSKTGIFLKYQKDWTKDKSPVKVIEKTRRCGLTWAEAADAALFAARINGGEDVWYIGYNKEMAIEFVNDCACWAKLYNEVVSDMEEEVLRDGDKDVLSYKITFASGNRVTGLCGSARVLRGKQGRVIVDEAAFHDNIEEVIKAALALIIWGSDIRIISTHNGEDNPFNILIKEIREGKKPYSLHRVTFEDAVKDGLYKQVCKRKKITWSKEGEEKWVQEIRDLYGDGAGEELDVVPSRSGGVYIPRILVENCMRAELPVIRLKCKDEFVHKDEEYRESTTLEWCRENLDPLLGKLEKFPSWFGEDFGRTGDLTVIMPIQQVENCMLVSPFIVELRNTPFEQQRQILFYIVDRLPLFRGGALDSRGNGQYLAEVAMQRYWASRIHCVMITNQWYLENMPKYKVVYEDSSLILANDLYLLDDHRLVKMENGIPKVCDKHTKEKDGGERHGDGAVAGCMSIYAYHNIQGEDFDPISANPYETEEIAECYQSTEEADIISFY